LEYTVMTMGTKIIVGTLATMEMRALLAHNDLG
jgi:hypothetical protein